MRTPLVLAVLLVAVAGCPRSGAPTQPPPSPPPAVGYQGGAADGASCDVNNDCASGVCEGQGCGVGAGVCAPASRACTKDLASYCGCDGTTFMASGSCPGARFDARGACGEETQRPAGPAADGAACHEAGECASGVCEGQGCGDDTPGVCVSAERICTTDVRPYCGCDGKPFGASGSCAGRRYASRGACPAPAKAADGAACLTAAECASGVCEGQGCGDDAPGVCAPATRGCTRDSRTYCGCDGKTFRASGSCPGQRFAARSACASAP